MAEYACGIDIGGSGIKAGVVDLDTGTVISEVLTHETPQPSTPETVTKVCAELLAALEVSSEIPVGVTFPAPIKNGRLPFVANLDQAWLETDIASLMSEKLGHAVVVVNDADAAALGEVYFGAARGVAGEVIVATLGTGIGSGIIVDGRLMPNVELGHLEIDGHDAESRASARVKTVEKLDWAEYIDRLQRYFSVVEMLFSPDLFVVGGGISECHEDFLPHLNLRTPIRPALLKNKAGIVGGACAATGRM